MPSDRRDLSPLLVRLSTRLYLLRRRWHFTRRIRYEIGYGWLDSWHVAGLNQRIALEATAAEKTERADFEASVLADLDRLEVLA